MTIVLQELYEHLCLSVLTDYLDGSAISPIQRDMVEIHRPFAGDVSGCLELWPQYTDEII